MAQMNAPRRELSIAFRIVKIDLIPRKLRPPKGAGPDPYFLEFLWKALKI